MVRDNFGDTVNPKWFGIALQALVVVAGHDEVCPSSSIAEKLKSQATLLRRIAAPLARAGIVEAREGRDGGYRLKKAPEQITLGQVYRALTVTSPLTNGLFQSLKDDGPMGDQIQEAFGELAGKVEEQIVQTLEQYTIADLMQKTAHPGQQ